MAFFVQAFGEEEGDGHDHDYGYDRTRIWRGCCVLAGILLFYMFELMLGLLKRKLVKRNYLLHSNAVLACMYICG